MQITSIKLLTNQLSETEKFYQSLLGLKIREKTGNAITFFAGSTLLTFTESDENVPVQHFAFRILNAQFRALIDWFSNRIVLIESKGGGKIVNFRDWHARSVYFYDNNGNILEAISRTGIAEQNISMENHDFIHSVCEIGIPASNVVAACEKLRGDIGIDYYVRQIPSEEFAALGDDDGLLILAKTGRNWFPTSREAMKSQIKVEISLNNQVYSLNF